MSTTPKPPASDPSPHITLAQFLKKLQLADSGGAAKHLARSGVATVNGTSENRPGRKLHAGDVVVIAGTRHVVDLVRSEDGDAGDA